MAETLINLIGRATTTSMQTKVTVQNDADTEMLRKSYEQLIVLPDWKEEFEKVADSIINNLISSMPTIDNTETQIAIASKGQLFEFDNNKCILLGSKEGCDIRLSSQLGCSRLHAILFPIPKLGIFSIVDLGSMNGIKTIKRNIGVDLIHSVEKKRNTLIFNWGEIAILNFGDQVVAINPKTCVICMDKPRDMKFNCGHYSTCKECTKSINACPICRKPKNNIIMGYDLNTKVMS